MPKVISRGTTVSSGTETQFTDEKIFVYYCVCGTLCLSMASPLEKLPKRRTDGAYAINSEKQQYRLKVKPLTPQPVTLKRDGGFEKQYRFGCVDCDLMVCYTPKDGEKEKNTITFVLPGALRMQQYVETSDPIPKEMIVEMSGIEVEELEEEEKEKAGEDEEANNKPAKLSELPVHEQERQIREKLRILDKGGDDDDAPKKPTPTTTTRAKEPESKEREEELRRKLEERKKEAGPKNGHDEDLHEKKEKKDVRDRSRSRSRSGSRERARKRSRDRSQERRGRKRDHSRERDHKRRRSRSTSRERRPKRDSRDRSRERARD